MNIKYISIILLFTLKLNLFAHSVVLQTIDNEDGTMEVFGGFSTGASASGAMLKIKSKINSKILYENRIPSSGTLLVDIPNEPYTIILDSGPGHRIEKSGDIEPENGFQSIGKKANIDLAFNSTLILSMIFILLSIILTVKRSNK